jgi:hypothetical protein
MSLAPEQDIFKEIEETRNNEQSLRLYFPEIAFIFDKYRSEISKIEYSSQINRLDPYIGYILEILTSKGKKKIMAELVLNDVEIEDASDNEFSHYIKIKLIEKTIRRFLDGRKETKSS